MSETEWPVVLMLLALTAVVKAGYERWQAETSTSRQ
jgi:hypothetical protein